VFIVRIVARSTGASWSGTTHLHTLTSRTLCCETNLQQLWRDVFCSCRSEAPSWSATSWHWLYDFHRVKRLLKTLLFGCWHRSTLWLTFKAASHKFSYLLTYLLTYAVTVLQISPSVDMAALYVLCMILLLISGGKNDVTIDLQLDLSLRRSRQANDVVLPLLCKLTFCVYLPVSVFFYIQ